MQSFDGLIQHAEEPELSSKGRYEKESLLQEWDFAHIPNYSESMVIERGPG